MVDITPIPAIREELVIAAKAGILVPFIGAGVSMLAGGPSWNGFADGAINFFVKQGRMNLSQFEQIKNLSPRIKLSLAKSMQEVHSTPIDFKNILMPTLGAHQKKNGDELYGYLSALSKKFVTTNYDDWLANEIRIPGFGVGAPPPLTVTPKQRTPFYKPEDLILANLVDDTVIHLHGVMDAPDQMIMTTADYVAHYLNDRHGAENRVLTFLKELFSTRCILFIGYGLEELEILEYVIQKAGKDHRNDPNEVKHFILQGFFTHEQVLADKMEEYYRRECGVQLLAFSKDENGWMQLKDVLREFALKIPVGKTLTVQDFEDMARLLDE